MFGSLVLFCLVLCLFSLLLRTRRGRNFPPGPMALPLLGNLLEFSAQNPIPDLNRAPGVVLSPSNSQWRDHRRFGLSSLRTFGLGKKWMEERILLEIQRVEEILEEGVGAIMNPQTLFHNLASNMISKVVFGSEYDHNHLVIEVSITAFRENSKIVNGPWAVVRPKEMI
ncbi:hypothetical protein NHX12_002288 [Muraenolepis orangiensis]|uniref:Cytochrome P450 n=1 Tax=Muraenolepis orangiensis TaxID=630683 RepID=A0A9Q0DY78_9TELE|nr:hypothetical protein NHX12_002288 [Muraenolepis orangiensis]